MLLDFQVLFQKPLLIAGLTIGVLVAKSIIAGGVTSMLGYPLRTAILAGTYTQSGGGIRVYPLKIGHRTRLAQ